MDSIFNLSVIIAAVDNLTGPVREMVRSMEGLDRMAARGREMQDWGTRMSVAGALTQGASTVANAALSSMLQPTREVEDALARVASIIEPASGTVVDATDRMRSAAIAWSREHQDSAASFIDTSYMMLSAGLNEAAAIEATRTAMAVATATMGESGAAANLIATVYNNMGDRTADVADEMTRLGDIITATQQTFQFANLDQLTQGLQYGVPVARQYGIEIGELSTVIGALNTAGLQGSMAGTAFSAAMRNMQRASEDLGFAVARTETGGVDFLGTLANIEAEFGSLAEMGPEMQGAFQAAFGEEGVRAIALLMGQSAALGGTLDDITASTGAAAEAQAVMERTASAQFAILDNNLDAVRMALGAHILPLINRVIPVLLSMADAIGRFTEASPTFVRVAVGIAVLGAGILAVVAPILSVVGGFAMMAGVGLQVVSRIGVAFVWLAPKIWAAGNMVVFFIGRLLLGAATAIPSFISGLMAMGAAAAGRVVAGLRAAAVAARAFGLALMANPIGLAVAAIAAGALLVWYYWEPISEFFVDLWADVQTAFEGFSSWVTSWWSRVTGWLSQGLDWARMIPSLSWADFVGLLTWENFLTVLDWLSWLMPLRWLDFIPGFSWAEVIGAVLDWADWITSLSWSEFVALFTWDNALQVLDWASWILPIRWLDFIPGFSWSAVIGSVLDWADWITSLSWAEFVALFTWDNALQVLDWVSWVSPLRWLDFIPGFSWAAIIETALDWGAWVMALDWSAYVPSFSSGFSWAAIIETALDWGAWVMALDWSAYVPSFSCFVADPAALARLHSRLQLGRGDRQRPGLG